MGTISGMNVSVFEDGILLPTGNNLDLSGVPYPFYLFGGGGVFIYLNFHFILDYS